LHGRSWVESLLKELNRRLQLPNFATCAIRVWRFQVVSHCGIIVQQNVLEVEDG
jgi:hypothetical protein